CASNWGFAYW
nr:immunoglobulin heavy chain junction region [Mus musculus]